MAKRKEKKVLPPGVRQKLTRAIQAGLGKAQLVPWEIEKDPEWQGIVARLEEDETGLDQIELWRQEAAFLFCRLQNEIALADAWRATAETLQNFRGEARVTFTHEARSRRHAKSERGSRPEARCREEAASEGVRTRPKQALRLVWDSDGRHLVEEPDAPK